MNYGMDKVHQVLSDYSNISEIDSRKICADFTSVGFPLPPDDLARDHHDMIIDLCEALESPDIRDAMLRGDEEIFYSEDSANDPFYYAVKVPESQIASYLTDQPGPYYCSICSSDETANNGVRLSCGLTDIQSCQSVYCRDCITSWVTKCCARCPVCKKFITQIKCKVKVKSKQTIEDNKNPAKKKVIITIKRKETKDITSVV